MNIGVNVGYEIFDHSTVYTGYEGIFGSSGATVGRFQVGFRRQF
ncbi:MAG: hypothetical protein WD342_15830 [Verrucomicrobiales bacterium]